MNLNWLCEPSGEEFGYLRQWRIPGHMNSPILMLTSYVFYAKILLGNIIKEPKMNNDKKEIIKIVLKIIAFPVALMLMSIGRNLLRVEYANLPFEESLPIILKKSLITTAICCAIVLLWFLIKLVLYLINNRKGQ